MLKHFSEMFLNFFLDWSLHKNNSPDLVIPAKAGIQFYAIRQLKSLKSLLKLAYWKRTFSEGFGIWNVHSVEKSIAKSNVSYSIRKTPIVINYVDAVIIRAIRAKANAICIESFEETVRIGFIKDRAFYEKQILPKKVEKAIISRLKLQSDINIDKSGEPQYGFSQVRVSLLVLRC